MDVEELHAFFEMPSTSVPWLSPDVIAIVAAQARHQSHRHPFQKGTGCCKLHR